MADGKRSIENHDELAARLTKEHAAVRFHLFAALGTGHVGAVAQSST
jgi:hypothetical protein